MTFLMNTYETKKFDILRGIFDFFINILLQLIFAKKGLLNSQAVRIRIRIVVVYSFSCVIPL
jgi:hypothetical protein